MTNLFLLIITFGTLIYISIKDKKMRASKYVFLLILCFISLHHWHLKLNHNYLNLVILLYILDEWLSFIPKLNSLNNIRRLSSIDYKYITYETLTMIPLNEIFNYAKNAKGIKTIQAENLCQFEFKTESTGTTEFYSKDFYSSIKIIQGGFDLIISDTYGNLTRTSHQTGENVLINPYKIHSFDYHDIPCKVIFKAIK